MEDLFPDDSNLLYIPFPPLCSSNYKPTVITEHSALDR